MNTHKTLLILVAGIAGATGAEGQTAPAAAATQGSARPVAQAPEALSAAQAARVKAVLAPYKADRLTVDDAKAIKRALRDAGMRPSPALDQALRGEGFSAERLDQLDPRPPGPPGGGEQQRPEGSGSAPARTAPKAPPG
jgi:hypothetical protein